MEDFEALKTDRDRLIALYEVLSPTSAPRARPTPVLGTFWKPALGCIAAGHVAKLCQVCYLLLLPARGAGPRRVPARGRGDGARARRARRGGPPRPRAGHAARLRGARPAAGCAANMHFCLRRCTFRNNSAFFHVFSNCVKLCQTLHQHLAEIWLTFGNILVDYFSKHRLVQMVSSKRWSHSSEILRVEQCKSA